MSLERNPLSYLEEDPKKEKPKKLGAPLSQEAQQINNIDPNDPDGKKKIEKTTKEGLQKIRGTVKPIGGATLETAINDKGAARLRMLASAGLEYQLSNDKNVQLQYSGLNQFTGNLESYIGRNSLSLGLKEIALKPIGVFRTNKNGIAEGSYGLRYMVQNKGGIDYGWIDVTGSKNGAHVDFFLGKQLGKSKKTSIEITELATLPKDPTTKKLSIQPYTELQLNREISKGFNVFVRGEVPGVKFDNASYLFGISKKLGK